MKPCVQMLGLVRYRMRGECRSRRFYEIRSGARNDAVDVSGGGGCGFAFLAVLDQFLQELAVYIEIAYRGGSATHLFERVEPFFRGMQQRIVGAFAQDSFDHSLKTARASTQIMHRIDIGIGSALFEIAAQGCCQLAYVFEAGVCGLWAACWPLPGYFGRLR